MYEMHKINNYDSAHNYSWMDTEPYYTIDFNVKFNGNLQLIEDEWKLSVTQNI